MESKTVNQENRYCAGVSSSVQTPRRVTLTFIFSRVIKKKDQLNTWVDVFDYFPSSQKITDLVTTFETDTFIERVMRSLDPYVFNYVT